MTSLHFTCKFYRRRERNPRSLVSSLTRSRLAVLLGLFFWINGSVSQAQEASSSLKSNRIGLELGWNQAWFRDLNFSPLNYSAGGVDIGINYQHTTTNQHQIFANIGFSPTSLKARPTDFFDSDRYLANLKIGYLRKIPALGTPFTLRAGLQYQSYVDVLFYDGVESVTFFVLHGFDLTGSLSYDINSRHKLSTTLSIPVFGQLVRPPYSGWDKFIVEAQDSPAGIFFRGKWTSLQDYFGLNWDLQYQYQASPRWDLTANYGFSYYRSDEPATVTSVNTKLSLGANFNF